jgi:hypothetical protein
LSNFGATKVATAEKIQQNMTIIALRDIERDKKKCLRDGVDSDLVL